MGVAGDIGNFNFNYNRELYEESHNRIITYAVKIKGDALKLAALFPENSDTHIFLKKLGAYLAMIGKHCVFESSYQQIDRRARFIKDCLTQITMSHDTTKPLSSKSNEEINELFNTIKAAMTQLDSLLHETEINSFKGCYTQRLYTILRTYQNHTNKRAQKITEALPTISKVTNAPSTDRDIPTIQNNNRLSVSNPKSTQSNTPKTTSNTPFSNTFFPLINIVCEYDEYGDFIDVSAPTFK